MTEDELRRLNRDAWDKRTPIHLESRFYDVAGFRSGATSLQEIERELLPDVRGKSLLHLQCHFGLDTLSWARLGARVTGVDFSGEAIASARALAADLKLDAAFHCADVLELADLNLPPQDIVFSSYGVLLWLDDLDRWAAQVREALRPGGRFYLVEFHPFHDFVAGYPYFGEGRAILEEEGTYTENCPGETARMATWSHPLSRVFQALIGQGLRIESFEEYPFSPYRCFEGLEELAPGRFAKMQGDHPMPLVFSLVARRPE